MQTFTLTVQQAPAITSAGSASATLGTAFSFTFTGGGYPLPSFTRSGSVPGLSFTSKLRGRKDPSWPRPALLAAALDQLDPDRQPRPRHITSGCVKPCPAVRADRSLGESDYGHQVDAEISF